MISFPLQYQQKYDVYRKPIIKWDKLGINDVENYTLSKEFRDMLEARNYDTSTPYFLKILGIENPFLMDTYTTKLVTPMKQGGKINKLIKNDN